MQINVSRVKLSSEFVRTVRKRGRPGEAGGAIFMFLRKQVYRHQSISFRPSSLSLNLIPRSLSSSRSLARERRNFWRNAPVPQWGYAKGGNAGSLRHVVHMSPGNEKYCDRSVARRVSNFETSGALLFFFSNSHLPRDSNWRVTVSITVS